jgi:hypothetical protein
MPFYFDYDLLLLAVPATLYAANRMEQAGDRWAVALWVALALSLFVNPYLATATRINVATLLLVGLTVRTGMQRWAAARAEIETASDGASPLFRAAA